MNKKFFGFYKQYVNKMKLRFNGNKIPLRLSGSEVDEVATNDLIIYKKQNKSS